MKKSFVLCMLLFVFSLSACLIVEYRDPPPFTLITNTFNGTVRDSVSDLVVSNVRVNLVESSTYKLLTNVVATNGTFALTHAHVGGTYFRIWVVDIDGTNNGSFLDAFFDIYIDTNGGTTNFDVIVTNTN